MSLRHCPFSQADAMTTITERRARRKLSLPRLASNLDNVSKACKLMGYSRQPFDQIGSALRLHVR